MDGTDGDRGVSTVIGAVLLFGILVVTLSTYQAVVVPNQTFDAEFDHHGQVVGDLQSLRSTILTVGATATGQSASIDAGVSYPQRLLAINPPPAAGTLRTVTPPNTTDEIRIENVDVLGGSNTALYWDNHQMRFPSRTLVYRPNYAEYRNAPRTRYEHSVLYHDFPDAAVGLADQAIVSGNRLTVVVLAGEFEETNADHLPIDVEPDSASPTALPIASDGNGPITLSFPTHLEPGEETEFIDPDEHDAVTDVAIDPDGRLTITLADQGFDLRLARVGVGRYQSDAEAQYITAVIGGSGVLEGQSFTAEVRDRYNNPVSGETVNASGDCDVMDKSSAETNEEGRVSFTCLDISDGPGGGQGPGGGGQGQSATVTLEILDGDANWEDVTFTVSR